MSSSSEAESHTRRTTRTAPAKKRDAQRPCDTCRRRKVKCDGPAKGKRTCTNCVTAGVECTYQKGAMKRGPSLKYVQQLEERVDRMEDLLKEISPGLNIDQRLGARPHDKAWEEELHTRRARPSATPPPNIAPSVSLQPMPDLHPEVMSDEDDASADDLRSGPTFLARWLNYVQINPAAPRLFGKSSGISLVRTALDLKNEHSGDPRSPLETIHRMAQRRPDIWRANPAESNDLGQYEHSMEGHTYQFPEQDLMDALVRRFFEELNISWPLLHRPTFEAEVASGLHTRDKSFGAVLLMVCAIGSRFVDDSRIFQDGVQGVQTPGWKWFRQAIVMRQAPWAPPSLYDLQLYSLLARYMVVSSRRQGAWVLVGTGLRLAQDIGIHRRKVYDTALTAREELWKRAFWCLTDLDRGFSWYLGRSCILQDEDFDIDMPIECDDEYWEGPVPFQQPPNKPSTMSGFIYSLKLNQILGIILRSLYSVNTPKSVYGLLQHKDQDLVAQLDSALNKWRDSLPSHLRWDPHRPTDVFFLQSAYLNATFYAMQIAIHRPFFATSRVSGRSPTPESAQSFASFAACTNAARAISHIIDVEHERTHKPLPHQTHNAYIAGAVLLIAIFRSKKHGLYLDPGKEMADVRKCIKVLKALEPKWHAASTLADILSELSSVGDLPGGGGERLKRAVPDGGEPPLKRPSPSAPSTSQLTSHHPSGDTVRPIPEQPPHWTFPAEGSSAALPNFSQPTLPSTGEPSPFAAYFGALGQNLLASMYASAGSNVETDGADAGLGSSALDLGALDLAAFDPLLGVQDFVGAMGGTEYELQATDGAIPSGAAASAEWDWFTNATSGYPEYRYFEPPHNM